MDSLKGKGRLSDNPPPYSQDNEEIPTYQAPSTGFENPPSDSKTPLNTLAKFPPSFQCYLDKQEGFYYLGPMASEERLFAFSASARLQTTMQPLHLHNGPSERDPIIVRMTQKNPRSVSFVATITIHDPSDPHTVVEEISYEKPVNSRSSSVFASCLAFRIKVGKEGREEEFQWRRSSGNEVKELARHSIGGKLVRMSGPRAGAGGSRKAREQGFSGDGNEVVAVLAPRSNIGIANGLKFKFMGTGLTGDLGEKWESVAVITGFWLFGISRAREKDSV
ncbi:hypothetical protein K4K57_005212 [Colletotrichum sp. SAR 10_99]|nr:hypothetical protein K4K55_005257 [Colletotrichum sp. SAR 10_96]KAI8285400.1 hypothetical protein K4K56_009506 [Colletotrichum sp. SAR 10_98]KAJ5011737.1 hypothetical protein K4K57_005212 [Colletotrichum sp. SAR 10_99]